MLKRLIVKNFALIDDLDVTFATSFNCLTGETGAGKTIILESLNLLFGSRADQTFIRDKNISCVVSGEFEISSDNLSYFDNQKEITITRTIDNNSNNTIKMNSQYISLAKLKDIGRKLGTIFLQGRSSSVLDSANLVSYLDRMDLKKSSELLLNYKMALDEYNELKRHLENLKTRKLSSLANKELLESQRKELEELDTSIDEDIRLKEYLDLMNNSEKILSSLNGVLNLFQNEDSSIIDNIYDASKQLNPISHINSKYEVLKTRLKDNYFDLKDILDEINKEIDDLNFDEEEFNLASSKLLSINKTMRKYDKTNNELVECLSSIKEELSISEDYDNYIGEYNKKVEASHNQLQVKAKSLSLHRQSMAKKLEKSIMDETKDLNLENTSLSFEFKETALLENGIDEITLMASFNKGEELKPFEKIASGGEKNRILMILEYLICNINKQQILIFDEIDNGISGKTLHLIGKKLSDISKHIQVIVITHSAILASKAVNHYKISKITQNGKNSTIIKLLSKDERIKEISYMISGEDVSSAAIEQAKILLK